MKTKRLLLAIVLGVFLAELAFGDLESRINGLLNKTDQKKVSYGIKIVDASNKKEVYSLNPNQAMMPASNMKVITTATALKYLGSGFEFKTQIGLSGENLVIVGGGDPLLGDKKTDAKYGKVSGWIFDDIACALKEKNITSINDIFADTSIFDDERVNPSWPTDQLNRWYACEVSGLNYYSNCIDMTVKVENSKTQITINPVTSYVQIENNVIVTSDSKKSAVGAYRNSVPNKIVIKGKCKSQEGPFDIAIERPAGFFSFLLAENLSKAGITTRGQFIEKQIDYAEPIILLREYKNSMADCITRCNTDSYGLAAECLIKAVGARKNGKGKNGSWADGRSAVSGYLKELGINETEFYINDGSGLSRENRLSANAITAVLYDVYHSSYSKLFEESLAVGGVEGTVDKRFKEENYKGKVFCKTGYISGVRTLSGWVKTSKGDYIFSIFSNNSNWYSKAVIDGIIGAIIDEAEGPFDKKKS
ncbi:MAG TPA: D-alanyl-D-alanine carboxypeptidase/D-alanyl-D-alanine-endopeptidase [Sedimentisphaerales bacterium]|nr:D-alanyl-D-alanine carboxypeptidase/D-alanyl-D-alanine-endopeptidase [Sedimentisphaerales bacterium]